MIVIQRIKNGAKRINECECRRIEWLGGNAPLDYIRRYIEIKTRCRPSMETRCIPDIALKNEGSMMQTCRNINVHVVKTDICRDLHES